METTIFYFYLLLYILFYCLLKKNRYVEYKIIYMCQSSIKANVSKFTFSKGVINLLL